MFWRAPLAQRFTGTYKSVLRYGLQRRPPPPMRPVRRVETRPGLHAHVDWVQSRPLIIEDGRPSGAAAGFRDNAQS